MDKGSIARIIAGIDLKVMRVAAEFTTSDMAAAIGLKSRKTVENWESGQSEPNINQWIKYCRITGHDPHKVLLEVFKRNDRDATQQTHIDLYACALKSI